MRSVSSTDALSEGPTAAAGPLVAPIWREAAGPLALSVERRPLADGSGPRLFAGDAQGEWLQAELRADAARLTRTSTGGGTIEADGVDPFDWLLEHLPVELDRASRSAAKWRGGPPSARPDLAGLLQRADAQLRNAPAALESLSIPRLQRRRSEKWGTHPPEVLPAWVAEMDFPLADPIQRVLAHAAEAQDVGYPLGLQASGIHAAFCSRMEERFGWSIDPARIEVTSEVVQSMYVALLAYSETGDGVVVQTPIYPPFLSAVRDTGRRLVENRLLRGTERFTIDFDALRGAVDRGTRVALLCNPHNPTGRAFERGELEALAELAIERDLVVVMDEIHSDLVYEGHRHIPFATLGEEVARRTVTLTSATKAFNIPGLRCSIAHFGSRELQERFNAAADRHVRGGLGLLGLQATVAAWRHGDPWLAEVMAVLDRNRRRVRSFVTEQVPGARLHAPEATYLAWIDFAEQALPTTPGRFFLREGKVALSDGPNFGSGLESHARLNFATSPAILEQVLERMARALHVRRPA